MSRSGRFEISLVIATYQRADSLKSLLNVLNSQTASKEVFEVIVVDNTPEKDNQVISLSNSQVYKDLNLHYIHHPVVGTSAARNRGVAAARSDLIGFLDDDSLPRPDWVEQVIRIFAETKADIVGGPFEPYYLDQKPDWFRDIYAGRTYGDQACWLTGTRTVFGNNMAIRKGLMQELGGFSEEFGYIGGKKVYGEDTDLNLRARKAGFTTWYDPCLKIQHYADPDRMRLGWQLESYWRGSRDLARIIYHQTDEKDGRPHYRVVLSLIRIALGNFWTCTSLILRTPFRNKNEYPFIENYLIERFGKEFWRFARNFGQLLLTIHEN